MTQRITKAKVLDAINGSGGTMLEVARRLGVSWATARAYVQKWDDTLAAFDIENEKMLDIAEKTIQDSIQGGDTQDAKWLLARKGKSRGYGDNVDVTSGGDVIKVTLVNDRSPD